VTNPSNYVWGPYGAAGNNGFTYGSGTGLNWSSFQTLTPEGVNNTPGTMFVPTLSLGSNAITLAPTMSIFDNSTQEFELDVYGLSGKASGSNHHALEYSSYFGAWTDILTSGDTDAYFWGVTTNAYDGALWGWTQGGTIYTNEAATLSGDGTILSQYTWSAGTGIAAGGPIGSAGSLWATTSGRCSGPPAGPCVEYFVPSGTFPGGAWDQLTTSGAEQITLDPSGGGSDIPPETLVLAEALYALGSDGNVRQLTNPSAGAYYWIELSQNKCIGGGTISFYQIAAKSGYVFGLDPSGTVFYYTSTNGCWTQVGSKKDFVASIATGNDNYTALWATDTNGQIWTAE